LAAVACVAGAAIPTRVAAQVEFTPFFASYYALVNTNDAFPVVDDNGVQVGTVNERQTPAPGVGAKLTFWLGSSFGLEAAGAFVPTGTKFTSDNANIRGGVSLQGRLFNATGRLLFRPARTNLHLLLGGGIVSRSGDTWEGFDGTTDISGVAGFGVRANITPKLALDVSVEGHLYQFDPDEDGSLYEGKFQSDIYVLIGVPISFGGR
jgi:hypothetical protein